MYPSVFNDVFGPVMIGSSSSAFAGPTRIGQIARDLYGGTPKKLKVSYVPESSRAALRVGLGTNMGILSGVLGWGPDDKRVFTAFKEAHNLGMRTDFVVEQIPGNCNPNAILLEMSDGQADTISLLGDSVGGGTIDIARIGDFPVEGIKGEEYILLVFHDEEEGFLDKLEHFCQEHLDFDWSCVLKKNTVKSMKDNRKILTQLFMEERIKNYSKIQELPGVSSVKQLNPIMPIVTKKAAKPPLFTSVSEMIALAQEEKTDCSEIVIRYEMGRACLSREEVIARMRDIWDIMKNTVAVGESGEVNHSRGPYHPLYGKHFVDRISQGQSLVSGIMADAMKNSICSHEGKSDDTTLTVAGPAAGAPPIMTGALGAVAKKIGCDDEDIVKALFTAAGIGVVTYMKTVPTGEITGCSGEVGVASAMAAGAIVSMMNGEPKKVDTAAAIALMNLFGIPCDPIAGGGCSMPCRGRSTLAPINSIMCAELALSGFDNVVPYDQVVDAMDSIFKGLPGYMKGSLDGGIPMSTAAKEVENRYQKWVN